MSKPPFHVGPKPPLLAGFLLFGPSRYVNGMRWTPKLLIAAGVVVAGFMVGNLSGRLAAARSWPLVKPPAPPPALAAPLAPAAPSPASPTRAQSLPRQTPEAPARASASADTPQLADWQQQLDAILRTHLDNADKARQLLDLYPSLVEEAQVETAAHIANLLPDSDYPAFGSYLADTNTPAPVLDILMADIRHRPDSLKLPLLLEVARMPDHPKSADAKDLLSTYLDHDYGADWNLWQQKVAQSVKDSADVIPFD